MAAATTLLRRASAGIRCVLSVEITSGVLVIDGSSRLLQQRLTSALSKPVADLLGGTRGVPRVPSLTRPPLQQHWRRGKTPGFAGLAPLTRPPVLSCFHSGITVWERALCTSAGSRVDHKGSSSMTNAGCDSKASPPVPPTRLIDFDSKELVEPESYVEEVDLLTNQCLNPLVTDADPVNGPYDFTRAMQSLSQSVCLLVVRNSNRGFCMVKSFKLGNVLISKEYNQIVLKEALVCDLDESNPARNRAAAFRAGKQFLVWILRQKGGHNVMSRLSGGPSDFMAKMSNALDERTVVLHTALLPIEAQAALVVKIDRLIKEHLHIGNTNLRALGVGVANSVLRSTRRRNWYDIAQSNLLLAYIYNFDATR